MESLSGCCFCRIARGQYKYPEVDRPFLKSSSYMAVASIGPMVEGWSLVIPVGHRLSLKNTYADIEFAVFTEMVISLLTRQYGPPVAFEHGSERENSPTSCGTGHAHLHLVPSGSLLPGLEKTGLEWQKCRTSEISSLAGDNEYLFYTEPGKTWQDPAGYLHILETPVSQFFRKITAEACGYPGRSDYKSHPNLELAGATRRKLVNAGVNI